MKKFSVYTDLVDDVVKTHSGLFQEEKRSFLKGHVTRLFLSKEEGEKIGKKAGNYSTIFFEDVTDETLEKAVLKALEEEIQFFLEKLKIKEDASCLIIGLGNLESTPDSLGPKSLHFVTVTNHLFTLGLDVLKKYRPLSAISPGVMAQTGIETSTYLLSLIKEIKPDFVIAIDALCSSSLERVMKTIQITDTGIHPGSGIGNQRKEISQETIHVPTLAIGVPTVVGASTIVSNTLHYLTKKISYQKEKGKHPSSKFLTGMEEYSEYENTLSKEEQQQLLGEVGVLDDESQYRLFEEVLTPLGYNLIVTPTEVDEQVEHLSKIIGKALDATLHKK